MIHHAYGEDDESELDHNTPLCDKCLQEATHFLKGGEQLCDRHFNDTIENEDDDDGNPSQIP